MAEALLLLASLAGNIYLIHQLRRAGRTILEREAQNKIARMEAERWQKMFYALFEDNGHQHVCDSDVRLDCASGRLFIYCSCGKQLKATGSVRHA
jgi:hypothetical protein